MSGARPRVTLKLATSLDGRIATSAGESQWITGPEARAEGHRLRAAHDAVVVGVGTALADDPLLTARTTPAPDRQPVRAVLDRTARLPATSRLALSVDEGPVCVVASAPDPTRAAALTACGVRVLALAAAPTEALGALMALADAYGAQSAYIEGGGMVAASFLADDLVDEIHWFRAPLILGGDGAAAVGPLGLARLADARRWRRVSAKPVGDDLWERYERAPRG